MHRGRIQFTTYTSLHHPTVVLLFHVYHIYLYPTTFQFSKHNYFTHPTTEVLPPVFSSLCFSSMFDSHIHHTADMEKGGGMSAILCNRRLRNSLHPVFSNTPHSSVVCQIKIFLQIFLILYNLSSRFLKRLHSNACYTSNRTDSLLVFIIPLLFTTFTTFHLYTPPSPCMRPHAHPIPPNSKLFFLCARAILESPH